MDIERIGDILRDSLGEFDGGDEPVAGSEVYDFILVKVALKTEKVHEHAAEMIELLKDWPSEAWGYPVPPLGEEISYLTAGAVVGDQSLAFILFAFGKILGWWDILDPHTVLRLDRDDPRARDLAGRGMISIIGYRPTDPA